jgi:hypothetical protein
MEISSGFFESPGLKNSRQNQYKWPHTGGQLKYHPRPPPNPPIGYYGPYPFSFFPLKKNEDQGILRLKNFLKRINMPESAIRCCLWDSALLQKK